MFRAYAFEFFVCSALIAQSSDAPAKFEAADIHASAKTTQLNNRFFRGARVRSGRYEVKNATMIDLIRTAYDYQADKIIGGPSWLEMDRFDVIAKLPADPAPDAQK